MPLSRPSHACFARFPQCPRPPSPAATLLLLQAVKALWKVLLCLVLFTLANMLKAVSAKLLSTHFYRWASARVHMHD